MTEQEKALWIEIYMQAWGRSNGNQAEAYRAADQAVDDFRKAQQKYERD